jgi:hypothetical protein
MLVLAVASSAAGCALTVQSGDPAPSSSVGSPAPPPDPSPTKPALADLVIGPDGLGSVALGQPVPHQADSVAVVRWDSEHCAGVAAGRGEPFDRTKPWSGAWIPAYPNYPFTVLTDNGLQTGTVALVSVASWDLDTSSVIGTATGIHAGSSTRTELLAAYPTFDQVIHGDNSDVYVVTGSRGNLQFEVSPHELDQFGYWRADQLDRVLSIRASVGGSEPYIGTDLGAPCGL